MDNAIANSHFARFDSMTRVSAACAAEFVVVFATIAARNSTYAGAAAELADLLATKTTSAHLDRAWADDQLAERALVMA